MFVVLWLNLLLRKEMSLESFVLVFSAAVENYSWLFSFPSPIHKRNKLEKVKICCFTNERESFARNEVCTEIWSLFCKAGLICLRWSALLQIAAERCAHGTSPAGAGETAWGKKYE